MVTAVLSGGCTDTATDSEKLSVSQDREKPKVDYKALVDSLVSKNTAPELVRGTPGTQYPVFPADYDWSEVQRIKKAIEVLIENGEEAWPQLIAGPADNRYSLTIHEEYSVTTSENVNAGTLCYLIVDSYIDAGVPGLDLDDEKQERPTRLPELEMELENKTMLDAQIAMCKQAISFVEKREELSAEKKRENVRALKERIESLEKSGKPIKGEVRIFRESWTPIHDLEQAAMVRREVVERAAEE
jgi:hypothetical protein